MMRIAGALVAMLLAGWSASALAEDGNLNLAPNGDWLIPLDDSDLYRRGGSLGGVAFRVIFTGSVDAEGVGVFNLSATVDDPDPLIDPIFQSTDGTFQIVASLGDSGIGGISTIIQIPGSNVLVNSSMFVQIVILNLLDPGDLPANFIEFVFPP